MGVRLPAEYQEVEYLEREANGAYIALPIAKYNLADSDLYLDLAVISPTSGERAYVGSNIFSSWEGYFPSSTWQYDASQLTIEVVESTISTLSVRGQIHYRFSDAAYIALTLFQYRSGGYQCANRYYGVRIEKNGVITAKFIPCYRKSDDKPGMYDLVSETFFVNQGSGEFLVGPDVVNHISPRLMDRRRALIAKLTSLFRKVITSQTGLASFDTNVAKAMKVTCEFSPKQDLHGQEYPYPAGGGKNLFDKSYIHDIDAWIDSNGGIAISGTDKVVIFECAGNTTYTISRISEEGRAIGFAVGYMDEEPAVRKTVSGYQRIGNGTGDRTSVTLTTDETSEYIACWVYDSTKSYDASVGYETILNSIQIELGSTATAYAPYENICPIEGWDGANVTGVGKNLINKAAGKTHSSYPRYIRFGVNNYDDTVPNKTIKLAAGQYTISMSGINSTVWESCAVLNETRTRVAISYNKKSLTFTLTSAGFYIVAITISSENFVSWDNYDIQLERGSTQTTYEPFMGTTFPIPFNNPGTYDFLPIQAGTGDPSPENVRPITPGLTLTRDDNTTLEVYGGSLTVNADGTGSLVSELTSPRNIGAPYIYGNNLCFSFDRTDMVNNSDPTGVKFVTEFMKYTGDYGTGLSVNLNNGFCFISSTGLNRLGLQEMAIGGELNPYWSNWYSSFADPPKVVASLALPVTYTLSVAETGRAFEALGLGKNLGPLYGGTVTVNEDGSCDVVVDSWFQEFTGEENWYDNTVSGNKKYFLAQTIPVQPVGGIVRDVKSSTAKYNANLGAGFDIPGYCMAYGFTAAKGWVGYCFDPDDIPTVEDFKSFLAELYANGTPAQFYAKLRTTQTYHFDNIGQLQSFLGTNNVWSDLNGAITVEYYKKQQ